MTTLLGGAANPLGSTMHFIEAPVEAVIAAYGEIFYDFREGGSATETGRRFDGALPLLLPLEAPWTRVLVSQCGQWTALTNNGHQGGDSTAPGPAISDRLKVRCVVASCVPRYGPGHQSTQLEILGPEGVPPLMYLRSISASATDGRWEWHTSGDPLEFEHAGRYSARLVRQRFDRDLLLSYLAALGIPAATDDAYGAAVLLQNNAAYERYEMTLEQARADFA